MTPALRKILLEDAFNPYQLSGNAAIYSVDGGESDATYRTNGLGRVKLIADRSGNSAVNCWSSNGSAGNSVSAANKTVTGNQTITLDLAMADYTPSADRVVVNKLSGNDGFQVLVLTTGVVRLRIGNGSTVTNVDSTVATGLTDLVRNTIAVVWEDGVGATFKKNGATFGDPVAAAVTLTNAATACVIGEAVVGNIYRAQIGSVYDMDPSGAAKLSATFTSGGDTWTVTTSGDLGARISGARDSVEFAATKIGLLSTDALGRNLLTLDGSNDYYKSAPFSLGQPTTVYFVGSQVSWTDVEGIFDGNTNSTGKLYQRTSTPNVKASSGASAIDLASTWAVGARGVISIVFNGAASSVRLNAFQSASGTLGTDAMNGFTLGASGDLITFSNVTFNEVIIRSAADPEWLQLKIARYLARKWAVAA